MMIMEGSEMSKTKYDLKAICILPMTHTMNCVIQAEIRQSGNPDYHPIMQADPCVSSNAPSLDSSREPDAILYSNDDFVETFVSTPS